MTGIPLLIVFCLAIVLMIVAISKFHIHPFLSLIKSGSEAVISGGTGELQPCATVHTIYPHTTNGVKASVSWVYLSITAVASASVTE